MSRTIRFPLLSSVPNVGPAETSLIINVFTNAVLLRTGGGPYVSTTPWKTIQRNTESPFTCFAIEFRAPQAMVIGDGTFAQQIGLFGGVGPAATRRFFLIGVLGIARGGVAPQIPIVQNSAGDFVGYAQMASDLSVYDSISVGAVSGDIVFPEDELLTVDVRPIRSREYMG
jgi:hypothetical protein